MSSTRQHCNPPTINGVGGGATHMCVGTVVTVTRQRSKYAASDWWIVLWVNLSAPATNGPRNKIFAVHLRALQSPGISSLDRARTPRKPYVGLNTHCLSPWTAELQLQLLVATAERLAHDVADPRDLVWPPGRHCVLEIGLSSSDPLLQLLQAIWNKIFPPALTLGRGTFQCHCRFGQMQLTLQLSNSLSQLPQF